MDAVRSKRKSLESLEENENISKKSNNSKNQELNEDNINENESKSESGSGSGSRSENNNNVNNESSEIKNYKLESNISEINNKNEENDSLLQKEINEINMNEISDKDKNLKENKKNKSKLTEIKSSKIKKSSKHNKQKINEKETQKSNFDDIIYSHNRFHNENILDYIKQKEMKEVSECSFKPKINKKIGFEVNKLNNNKEENDDDYIQNKNVVDRLLLWNQRVKQKLIDIKDKRDKEKIEKDKCTFSPELKTEVPKFEKKKINGTEKYYDRIKNCREIKKQKEKKLNPDYDELYNKYYKNKEKTFLQKNKKLTKKVYQNYLNQFHNMIMNDD